MDTRIEIGREPQGANAIQVPEKLNKVSRRHAFIYMQNGAVTIEDNGSTNGTFVNGNRITKTQIYENDLVWLGGFGSDCYQLDVKNAIASCRGASSTQTNHCPPQNSGMSPQKPMVDDSQRTDYTSEFARIKQAYIDYHAELSDLKNKASKRMQLPRLLVSMIPALLGLVILIVSKDMTVRIVAMSAGSVLSGLIGTLTMGKNNARQEEMSEKILDLQLKYQKEYKCPKCGKEYSLDLHWKKLQADGKCPYGCGARFV